MKHKLSALLVDDDTDWLLLIQTALGAQGLRTDTSVNGVDLWEKIQLFHPDIILLDIAMKGDRTGETFCRELKTNEETANIPIIMLSSNDRLQAIAKACGADGFLAKSAAPAQLVREINKVLHAA